MRSCQGLTGSCIGGCVADQPPAGAEREGTAMSYRGSKVRRFLGQAVQRCCMHACMPHAHGMGNLCLVCMMGILCMVKHRGDACFCSKGFAPGSHEMQDVPPCMHMAQKGQPALLWMVAYACMLFKLPVLHVQCCILCQAVLLHAAKSPCSAGSLTPSLNPEETLVSHQAFGLRLLSQTSTR